MSEFRASLVLVATIGTTSAVLRRTLEFHAPTALVLVASTDTVGPALETSADLAPEIVPEVVPIEDIEDLWGCLRAGREALARAYALDPAAVVVDFTGGTKAMAAGLTLAAAGRDVAFSYVGGAQRDELGRVVDGSERMRLLADPTPNIESDIWHEFKVAWNGWRFKGASGLALRLAKLLSSPKQEKLYRALAGVCDALAAWDNLDYASAHRSIRRPLEEALGISEEYHHGAKVRVLRDIGQLAPFLANLVTGGHENSEVLAADLAANAARRLEAGAVEDAAVRVRRAAELVGRLQSIEASGGVGILNGGSNSADYSTVLSALKRLAAVSSLVIRPFPRW